MSAEVETMAYAGQVPWHGLGTQIPDNLNPEEILKVAELDWTVERQPMYLKDGTKVPRRYALVRDKDNRVLSTVGPSYKPVQNREAFEFFERFTSTGMVTMETAGSLKGGQHVWGLAKMQSGFTLPGKDEVENYLLVHQPHVHGRAFGIQLTPIRVVCWNTITMALSGRAARAVFKMAHSQVFNEAVQEQAVQALGLIETQVSEFAEAAQILSKKRAKKDEVEEYFCEILAFDPSNAAVKKDGEPRLPRLLPKFQEALVTGPGQNLQSASGTWWGAFNAVTFTIDHLNAANDRDKALTSAWFGPGIEKKHKALNLALKRAA